MPASPAVPSSTQSPGRIVVAGGGVAGLACATALARAGWAVDLHEASDHLGGRASSWTDAPTGERVDIGPHVVSSIHTQFMAWLQVLGTAGEILWQPDPVLTLLDQPGVVDMRFNGWPAPLHGLPSVRPTLRCIGLADLASNLRVAWRASRLTEASTLALDGEDALGWLQRHGVRAAAIDWFWETACLSLLNVPLADCSAAALMRVFRLFFGRSRFQFGFPRIGLGDLFGPAARTVIEAAGGSVQLHSRVDKVLVQEGRIAGLALQDGSRVPATAAVLALAPAPLAGLLARSAVPALDDLQAVAAAVRPVRYISTVAWFDRHLTPCRFWARTARLGGLNTDFYDLANIRHGVQGGGSVIACNAIDASDEEWARSDAQIVRQAQEEIRAFCADAAGARLVHARVHRIPMAVPRPSPGTERQRPGNATPVQGLWIAGDWTATALPCSMESACRSGAAAAQAVAAARGRSLQVLLPRPETGGLVGMLRPREPRERLSA